MKTDELTKRPEGYGWRELKRGDGSPSGIWTRTEADALRDDPKLRTDPALDAAGEDMNRAETNPKTR